MRKFHFILLALIGLWPALLNAQSKPAYKRTKDVIYGRKDGMALTMDVFRPVKANGRGVIFLVSGGWLSSYNSPGMVTVYPDSLKLILDRGYTVFAVVHGSQPKYVISDIVQDLHRAVRFIRHNAHTYGLDPGRLGITGSSSGGQLALMIATQGGPGNPSAPDPVDRESSAIQAAGVFFPPTDFLNWGAPGVDAVGQNTMAPLKAAFGPRSDTAAGRQIYGREISPVYFVTSNLPPIAIVHGDADVVVPLQQSELFIQKAREVGAKIPELVVRHGKGHGWGQNGQLTGNFWQSKEDIQVFTDCFDKYLRNMPATNPAVPAKPSP